MKNKTQNFIRRIVGHCRSTYVKKIVAILLALMGVLTYAISDYTDGTACALLIIIAIFLFFDKD